MSVEVFGICYTSVIQKLFFRTLTPGDVEKTLPQKDLMADVMLWAALCGYDILVAPTISQNGFQQPPKSMGMCSSWCHMDTDVFEVVNLFNN